ncbi:MAG TPA: DUF3618 domain-containing protein [Streptosporangiaceae bacterium]|jgi:hypothetical protein|nr:DUF3618 domain-containing protein [Streptosporangiaceae bacterium]
MVIKAERELAMADGDRAPAVGGQENLVHEIEQTRENLARTIDAITERVSPANVARRTRDRVRQRAQALDPRLIGAGAVVAVGLVAFLVWRRRH